MSIAAVVFDLFGTLVPPFSRSAYLRCTSEMAALLSVPHVAFDSAWIAAYPERGIGAARPADQIIGICRELGRPPPDEQTVTAAMDLRHAFFRRTIVPRRGVVEVLEALRLSACKLGLVSNCSSEAPGVWPDTSLARFFDAAVFSCEARCHKPDPKIYRDVMDSLDVPPYRCLYVGDGGSRELTGARAVGMKPMLLKVPEEQDAVTYLLDEREAWQGRTISSLDEILPLIDGSGSE